MIHSNKLKIQLFFFLNNSRCGSYIEREKTHVSELKAQIVARKKVVHGMT